VIPRTPNLAVPRQILFGRWDLERQADARRITPPPIWGLPDILPRPQ